MPRISRIRLSRKRKGPDTRGGRVLSAMEATYQAHPEHEGLGVFIVAVEPVGDDGRVTFRSVGFESGEQVHRILLTTAEALRRGLVVEDVISPEPPDAA